MPHGVRADLTGLVTGRLTVIGASDRRYRSEKLWHCKCACGRECYKRTSSLRPGCTISCGCARDEQAVENWKGASFRHGNSYSREYRLWAGARARAKGKGLPFTIAFEDIKVPEFCPILGIKLEWAEKGWRLDNSPSLDRIIPALGYVTGNVAIISWKANTIKRHGTLQELRAIVAWLERQP